MGLGLGLGLEWVMVIRVDRITPIKVYIRLRLECWG